MRFRLIVCHKKTNAQTLLLAPSRLSHGRDATHSQASMAGCVLNSQLKHYASRRTSRSPFSKREGKRKRKRKPVGSALFFFLSRTAASSASLSALCYAPVVGKLKGISDCSAGIIDRARHFEIPLNVTVTSRVIISLVPHAVSARCRSSFCTPATRISSLEALLGANIKRDR